MVSDDTDCEEHVIISRRGSVIISSMVDGRSHPLLLPLHEEPPDARRGDLAHNHDQLQEQSDSWIIMKRPSISLANYGSNVFMFDNNIVDNSSRKAIGNHILRALHKVRFQQNLKTH
jgi:hypothetical protein